MRALLAPSRKCRPEHGTSRFVRSLRKRRRVGNKNGGTSLNLRRDAERGGVCRGAAVPAVGPPDILSGVCNLAGETPACPTDKMSAPRFAFQRPVFRI